MQLKAITEVPIEHRPTERGDLPRHNYFGVSTKRVPGPQAFMVHWPANMPGPAHFHAVDQWQVFFGKPGAYYENLAVPPVLVHYVDAYTPYGPFGSKESAFDFYTLRAQGDTFIAIMPQGRKELKRRPRRSLHADVHLSADGNPLPPGAGAIETLIEPQPDGLAAFLLKAGPGGRVTAPDPRAGSGQYYAVVGGAVVREGKTFGPQSLGWAEREDSPPVLSAGPDAGFEVVVMQYPYPATTHDL